MALFMVNFTDDFQMHSLALAGVTFWRLLPAAFSLSPSPSLPTSLPVSLSARFHRCSISDSTVVYESLRSGRHRSLNGRPGAARPDKDLGEPGTPRNRHTPRECRQHPSLGDDASSTAYTNDPRRARERISPARARSLGSHSFHGVRCYYSKRELKISGGRLTNRQAYCAIFGPAFFSHRTELVLVTKPPCVVIFLYTGSSADRSTVNRYINQ